MSEPHEQNKLLHRLEIIARPGSGPEGEDADLVTAILALQVSHGWEEETLADGSALFRVHAHDPLFCQELESLLLSQAPALQTRRDSVEELDWVNSWKEFFTPVEAGSRFLVLPPWLEEERLKTGRTPIIIEPKTAFGTGHHATTALCLTALSDLFDAGRLKAGQTFLDLGTGSGILGLGAALLGLYGLGVDLDSMAVDNARENWRINQALAKRRAEPAALTIRRGSLEAVAGGPFDLVMANILAEPLRNMAPALIREVRPGGCLILSGILDTQAESVASAYAALGSPEIHRQDEWVALVWARAGSAQAATDGAAPQGQNQA
ncbi:50S ribosomal protein L11 methyltransferase [Desulfovibrio sp. OttesenSCG-928-C14]|nr:50S ribosomal protein L11 methyltransferase [Desulfovibrio sp. OttesenSCG-928-C14]